MKKINAQIDNLREKILKALEESGKKLLEQKRKNKQKMAISENGKVKIIDFAKQSEKLSKNQS